MVDLPLVGSLIEFEYPASNYFGARLRWERRRVIVETIRDLALQPLEPLAVATDPQLRRGRFLLTGQDLDKDGQRSFYGESMRGLRLAEPAEPGAYSVAWIETAEAWRPGDEMPDEFKLMGWLAKDVSRVIAEVIAGGANQLASRAQQSGRWALVLPPGWVTQFGT